MSLMAASNCLAQPRKLSPVTSKKESDQPPRPFWVSIRRTADMKVSLSPHHVLSSAVFRLRRFKTKLVRGSYNRKEGTKHVPQKKTTHKNPTLADQHLLNWFIFYIAKCQIAFLCWKTQNGNLVMSSWPTFGVDDRFSTTERILKFLLYTLTGNQF